MQGDHDDSRSQIFDEKKGRSHWLKSFYSKTFFHQQHQADCQDNGLLNLLSFNHLIPNDFLNHFFFQILADRYFLCPDIQYVSFNTPDLNLGFNVNGSFGGLEGEIQFDPAHPELCHFGVSVDAASMNRDNSLRDEHLRNDSYFDVKKYPRSISNQPGFYQQVKMALLF